MQRTRSALVQPSMRNYKDRISVQVQTIRMYMHQNKELLIKGRGAKLALELLNLGLASDYNKSGYKVLIEETGYKLLIEETGKFLISNQVS